MAEELEMGHHERRDVLYDQEELKNTFFDEGLHTLVTIIFTILVSVVMLQVLVRYFLGALLGFRAPWTEELARYLMIFTAYFGSAVAWRKRENISINYFTDMLPRRFNVYLKVFTDTLVLGFALICAYGAYLMSIRMGGSPLGTLKIGTVGNIYFAMAICFVIVVQYMVRWLVTWAVVIGRMRRDRR